MIRSSKHTLKFTNKEKMQNLSLLIAEYRRLLQVIVDDFWNGKYAHENFDISKNQFDLKPFVLNKYLSSYDSWLGTAMRQSVAAKSISMLRSATQKRRQQLFMLKKLQKENKFHRFLQSKIDRQELVKPNASNANLELDQRFVDFKQEDNFLFVRIGRIGNKTHIKIPIKATKVSKKWSEKGKLKKSIQLSDDCLRLFYEIEPAKISGTEIVGADQGIANVLSLSNGVATKRCNHGHNLQTIQAKLSRKKKGSKSFKRAQSHRKNYVNWSLNQLDFSNIKEVRLEKISNIGYKKKSSRYLSHWKYTEIKSKLVSLGEEKGFLITEVSNEFRSQRCSSCGWVRKANRKGKTFKCGECGFTFDADLNAASNLSLDLFEIPFWVRSSKINLKGFFWKPDGLFDERQERIVPVAQKDVTL